MLFVLFKFLTTHNAIKFEVQQLETKRTSLMKWFSCKCCAQELIVKFTYLKDGNLLGKQMSSPSQHIWGRTISLLTVVWLSHLSFMRRDGLHWRKALNQSDLGPQLLLMGSPQIPLQAPLSQPPRVPRCCCSVASGTASNAMCERRRGGGRSTTSPGQLPTWLAVLARTVAFDRPQL